MQEKAKQEKENVGDKINEFIQRNRKVIFVIASLLIVLFVGSLVFLSVKDNINKKASVRLEELTLKYEELKNRINEEDSKEEADAFLDELETFAAKTKGFSGSKAWSIIADIHAGRKDWAPAEEAYASSGRAGEKTYLGPLSYFNAAAAAEEQGKYETAIDLLQKSLSSKIEFPIAARAQFAVGRLNEKLGNTSEAITAYRTVMEKWSQLPAWQQLAQSRITALETK